VHVILWCLHCVQMFSVHSRTNILSFPLLFICKLWFSTLILSYCSRTNRLITLITCFNSWYFTLVFYSQRLLNYLALWIPDGGCSRNAPCALNLISTFLLLSLARYVSCVDPLGLFFFRFQRLLNYLALKKCFGFVRAWWRLFPRSVVRTKFDIYVFILQKI